MFVLHLFRWTSLNVANIFIVYLFHIKKAWMLEKWGLQNNAVFFAPE